MRPVENWRGKLTGLAVLAAAVAAMLLLKAGCPIRWLTGVPCAGCGMTRALLALLHGDFAGALQLHGMVWSLPVLLLLYLYDGRIFRARWANRTLWLLLGTGFLLNWLRHLS